MRHNLGTIDQLQKFAILYGGTFMGYIDVVESPATTGNELIQEFYGYNLRVVETDLND